MREDNKLKMGKAMRNETIDEDDEYTKPKKLKSKTLKSKKLKPKRKPRKDRDEVVHHIAN
jgi:hypothetical protein